jgi:hypothetical protein
LFASSAGVSAAKRWPPGVLNAKIPLLLRAKLLLGALAGNIAHAGNVIVGVHINNVESMAEPAVKTRWR